LYTLFIFDLEVHTDMSESTRDSTKLHCVLIWLTQQLN